jgi:hypothetical protein
MEKRRKKDRSKKSSAEDSYIALTKGSKVAVHEENKKHPFFIGEVTEVVFYKSIPDVVNIKICSCVKERNLVGKVATMKYAHIKKSKALWRIQTIQAQETFNKKQYILKKAA